MTQATRTPSRTQTPHAHHWMIATPNGDVESFAYCKTCPATRTFANAVTWDGADAHWRAWQHLRAESPLATERIRLAAAAEVAQAFEGVS